MFKFDFAIDDIDESIEGLSPESSEVVPKEEPTYAQLPSQEHTITQFLDALPSLISYSSLIVSNASGKQPVTIIHRDLFDARFQLISEGRGESVKSENEKDGGVNQGSVLTYLDTPSDLLPGVYEGGLKTWECSLDVVEYLETATPFSTYQGKRVLEVGCGTAVPSLYVLQKVFSIPEEEATAPTEIHLQDYNESVLELMTFPNIFLTWYSSPASLSFRQSSESEDLDKTTHGDAHIADELKAAFLSSLKSRDITIRFFSGSWETFDLVQSGGNYDLLITSETIYRTESLAPLTRILDEGSVEPLSSMASKLSVDDNTGPSQQDSSPVCLIAAKVLYFGVGGGISEFVEFVTQGKPGRKGRVETVLEKVTGVGRQLLSVQWI